ncbi:MAG: hypothetical protein ABI464_12385 [Chthoniobacteraceae bacterium]
MNIAILTHKAFAGEDDGGNDGLGHAGFAELLEDGLVHDIVHARAVELAQCDGVIHMMVRQFDDVRRAQAAPSLELVDEGGGDSGRADGGELFLGLRGAPGEEKCG